MRRLLLTSCVFALTLCPPTGFGGAAWAQDRVQIRTGAHDGYSRLVFDWSAAAPYTLTHPNPSTLELDFKHPASADLAGVDQDALPVKQVSAPGENLKIQVTIPPGTKSRDFQVDNKVILDIYIKTSTKAEPPPKPKPPANPPVTEPAAPKPPPEAAVKPVPVKAAPIKPARPAPVLTIAPEKPAPEKPKAKKPEQPPVPAMPAPVVEKASTTPPPAAITPPPLQMTQANTITVSSTSAVGVAVFRRNDDLWVVLDRADLSIPPQLTGPEKDKFTPFEKIESDSGVAYRTRMPEGVNVYGEGNGLIWKISLLPAEHDVKPVAPERSFAPGQDIRGGTLFWPMQRVTRVIRVKDPEIGDAILVGTVTAADQFTGAGRDYVDFNQLNAPVGIAIVPKTDDVTLALQANGVQVTRPGGLALTRLRDTVERELSPVATPAPAPGKSADAAQPQSSGKRIFDFDRWTMGGITALRENQQIMLTALGAKDKTAKVQDLLMLAKMNIANDRGQEAIGFLNFAADEMPDIAQTPEYLALRGAAEALAGKFETALADFSTPVLKDYPELDYWRAYTLASLDDWQQAKDVMPRNFDTLLTYPRGIQDRLVLKLAELALRSKNLPLANDLLSALEKSRKDLQPWTQAGLDYLLGEKHQLAGETAQAEELWRPLTKGKDDLYRAKASLALTLLQLQSKEIWRDQAIDQLEGLRYHWRGDELEAQDNFLLGKMYIEDGRYEKGFTILRDAMDMAPDSDISHEIPVYMAQAFKDLFLTDKLDKVNAVDADSVFEQFHDLVPKGEEGDKMIDRLAEHMVDADLLDPAAKLLQNLADTRLTGEASADVDARIGAIQILNKNPQAAVAALDKAGKIYSGLPKSDTIAQKLKDTDLLRARALSDMKRVDEALAILNKYPPSPSVNRLRADIAWNAGMWQDAAAALQDLIADEALDPARPLSQKQADLILNRAVALNLSGDRVALANMKSKYGDAMDKTSRAKMFDVVTRQRTGSLSSDRESMAALVSEVDLFKDFLDSYRANGQTPSN